MKKFLFSAAVVAAMAIGYTFSYSDSEPALSDIELANVEALADNEGDFEYPTGHPYSTTCNVAIGKNFFGGTTKCKVEVIICQGGGAGCNSKKCPVHPA